MILLTAGVFVAMHRCMGEPSKNKGAAALAAGVEEPSQALVAGEIGRSQSQVSRYVSGQILPEFAPRFAAWEKRGIALTSWDEPLDPPDASDGAHPCEPPQAAQMTPDPAFSDAAVTS